jgi:phenylacetic acid degradation operon negative regulatory protein
MARSAPASKATARSLLTTVLANYVYPDDASVSTLAMVRAMADLGVADGTTRQVVARMAQAGWLARDPGGREVRWRLTDQTRRRFGEARPLNAFLYHPEPAETDWALLLLTVPTERQAIRHRLRRRLAAAGWGSVGPAAWLGATPRCEIGLDRILENLGLAGGELLLRGDLARPSSGELVARTWDLDEINDRYHQFLGEFGDLVATTDAEAFRANMTMVDAWHRWFTSDPHLPTRHLPPHWAGPEARTLVVAQGARWTPGATRRWAELAGELDDAAPARA